MIAHMICVLSTFPNDASVLQTAISALESDIAALERSSSCWEYLLPFFTLLVAVGVAMEILVIHRDHSEDLEDWRLCKLIPDKPSVTKVKLEIASVILVTVGILGELGVGLWISHINGQLRTKSSALRNKSDQLVALLSEQSSANKKLAEDEHMARVELEDRVAWRRLSEREAKIVSDGLRRFIGENAHFWYGIGNDESLLFTIDIEKALHGARWMVVSPGAVMISTPAGLPGMIPKPTPTGVGVESSQDLRSRAAATALVKVLCSLGFDAVNNGPTQKNAPDPQVLIYVYPRPQGPQGEAKLREQANNSKHPNKQTDKP